MWARNFCPSAPVIRPDASFSSCSSLRHDSSELTEVSDITHLPVGVKIFVGFSNPRQNAPLGLEHGVGRHAQMLADFLGRPVLKDKKLERLERLLLEVASDLVHALLNDGAAPFGLPEIAHGPVVGDGGD